LRNSGSLLKTNLTSSYGPQRMMGDSDNTCSSSPSMVSPLLRSSLFLDDEPLTFNIFDTVLSLRRCRSGMVQNVDQYIFCYKAIIDELRSHGLLDEESDGLSEEDTVKSKSDERSTTLYEKCDKHHPTAPVVKQNPFAGRSGLLTSIEIGCLNTSSSPKQINAPSFDAEFHPSPSLEGASLTKSILLTQHSPVVPNPLTSSTVHGSVLFQDSRHTIILHPPDSVHSTGTRAIPIRSRTQPVLQPQSPTLIVKSMSMTEESQLAKMLRPIGKTDDRTNRPMTGNGHEKGRVPPSNLLAPSSLLTRSAISPSVSLMSTSAPTQRNPMLLGRSPGHSPGVVSSPL